MHGTYVNFAAAIDALARAERAAKEADDAYRTEHNPPMLIELAAKQRAQEPQP